MIIGNGTTGFSYTMIIGWEPWASHELLLFGGIMNYDYREVLWTMVIGWVHKQKSFNDPTDYDH